jgi:hypothetical protein
VAKKIQILNRMMESRGTGLNRNIRKLILEFVNMPSDKPFVGLYLMEKEDEQLQQLASDHNIKRVQLARACMRVGMKILEQFPEKVLPLAGLYEVA